MDFGKPLVDYENVTTKSGIKLIEASEESDPINTLLIQCANQASGELFLSTGSKLFSTVKNVSGKTNIEGRKDLIDCSLYLTKYKPYSETIKEGTLVVIFESFDNLNFTYVKRGNIFNNRNGAFHHNDFIGKTFGSKIRCRDRRGLGFVHLLRPTPELWARSLNHRTQIVHELDASMIIFNLNLRPNMVVCESGTGSGAMSHAIMRAIAPQGKLHTYEFNKMRAQTARAEFEKNGVGNLVQCHWRDVCGKHDPHGNNTDSTDEEKIGSGGFNLGPSAADAIFLDLPEPWLAIPHAAHTIKKNGNICSYSPCMEQTQRTCQAMRQYGFHSIRTIEVRLREHYVDELELSTVPTRKLPRDMNVSNYVPGKPAETVTLEEDSEAFTDKESIKNRGDKKEDNNPPEDLSNLAPARKKPKILAARPFQTMRGHTAFLTFASAGSQLFPDPNNNKTTDT